MTPMLRSSLDVVQVKFTGESLPRWQGTRAGTGSRSEPEILNPPPGFCQCYWHVIWWFCENWGTILPNNPKDLNRPIRQSCSSHFTHLATCGTDIKGMLLTEKHIARSTNREGVVEVTHT